MEADRQGTGDRPKAGDRDHDGDGQNDLGKGADGVEHLAHDVRNEAARDVPRAEEAERQREDGADDRADPGELERFDHALDGVRQVAPVRSLLEEHLVEDEREAGGKLQDLGRIHADRDRRPDEQERGQQEREVALRVRRALGADRQGRRGHTSLRRR